MCARRKDLLSDAFELTEEDWGALAVELLDSISAPSPRTEAEWIVEVERRARRAVTFVAEQPDDG
jgi:hypothetical protein